MGSTEELEGRLEAFCADRLGEPVEVAELRRLPGGASRETWSFVLRGPQERRLVLRRDPPGAPTRSDRSVEAELLRRASEAGVPVPDVVWTATDGAELGAPAFVMEHVVGETIGSRIVRREEFAAARPRMAAQCGEILARLHSVPTDGLPGFEPPGGNPAVAAVDQYRSTLDSVGEPHPAIELGLRWLERHIPEPSRTTLVHGDFRNGNLIVGPDGVRAVLDWELAHTGDPWEDLAWLCTRTWRFGGPGEVGGFGDREDLYRAYEKESGIPVDRDAVRWWEVLSSVKWGVITVMQAFTHLWGHVRSVELAAIGRRTAEVEYDLLHLLGAGSAARGSE